MLGVSGDNRIKEKPREGCPEGCVPLIWCFSDSDQKTRAIGIPRMLPKARGWGSTDLVQKSSCCRILPKGG